jgi:hypothetical protein
MVGRPDPDANLHRETDSDQGCGRYSQADRIAGSRKIDDKKVEGYRADNGRRNDDETD